MSLPIHASYLSFFSALNSDNFDTCLSLCTPKCIFFINGIEKTPTEWYKSVSLGIKQIFLTFNDVYTTLSDISCSHEGYIQRIANDHILQIYHVRDIFILDPNGSQSNSWLLSERKITIMSENLKRIEQLSLGLTRDEYKWMKKNSKKPKRIILVRHGESEGNVNHNLYATKPDNKLCLTDRGIQQAVDCGKLLKEIIGDESVKFFLSPFQRTRQTFENIALAWGGKDAVRSKVDPRLREQEWGNLQDPDQMERIVNERREIGQFYYRFNTGEAGTDVADRVSTFLESLYRDFKGDNCERNMILVTHGLTCRLFLMRFFHWDVDLFHSLWNFDSIVLYTHD